MNYCRAKISCEQTRLSAAAFVPENLLVSSTPAMPTPPMHTCKRSWRKAMAASVRAPRLCGRSLLILVFRLLSKAQQLSCCDEST